MTKQEKSKRYKDAVENSQYKPQQNEDLLTTTINRIEFYRMEFIRLGMIHQALVLGMTLTALQNNDIAWDKATETMLRARYCDNKE